MKFVFPALLTMLVWPGSGRAELQAILEEETLHYTVNWPSGLSLGEGELHASKVKTEDGASDRWQFEMKLDAAVPGFQVVDHHRALASMDLCSVEFEKDAVHGKRKARERTTFDRQAGTATRQTLDGGGKSEVSIPACPKDALTFLYYVRSELGRGRIPPPQQILFGATYDIRLEYGGRQTLRLADGVFETDRMLASVKGKTSEVKFEIFFATDAARRPVLVRLPLEMGTFTMQLVE
jgi:hypothetical protein